MLQFLEDRLLCPICSETYLHLESVYISGRPREDGPTVLGWVDHHGHFHEEDTQSASLDLWLNVGGRRHSFALGGYCETCGSSLVIEFRQHKGETVVSVKQQTYSAVISQ